MPRVAVGVNCFFVRRDALHFVGRPVGEVQLEGRHGRRASKVFVGQPDLEE